MFGRSRVFAYLTGVVLMGLTVSCEGSRSGELSSEANVGAEAAAVVEGSGRLSVTMRVGSQDGEGPESFGKVSALAVDGAGRLYVADRLVKRVVVFDVDGEVLRVLGREGAGPGEFREPLGLGWRDSSSLWVIDYWNNSYSVFDTAGRFVTGHQRGPLGSLWPWPGRFVQGYLVEALLGGGAHRLVRIDPDETLRVVDTLPFPLAPFPLEQWSPSVWIRRESTVRRISVPFEPGIQWVVTERGTVWIGDPHAYRVWETLLSGEIVRTIDRAVGAVPLTAVERSESLGPPGSRGREELERLLPELRPLFNLLVPTPEGGLWVIREPEADLWEVDVFDRDAGFVGTLDLPLAPDVSVIPVHTGTSLWMVTADSLGVQYVVRLVPEWASGPR